MRHDPPAAPQGYAIVVNGVSRHVPPGITLAALVAQLGTDPHEVATAVDGLFVARDARARCVLAPGARISCFQPVVGG